MDLSVYRSEFPITESYIYVNHASVSPLPRRVVTAMNDFAEDVDAQRDRPFFELVTMLQRSPFGCGTLAGRQSG